jgi:GTP cyclohydrolase I
MMSDIASIDSEDQASGAQRASGDNSIPTGEEERIIAAMAKHMEAMMRELNLDLTDANYVDTPRRVAKMYLEMFHGLREGAEPKITTFPNEEGYHHMVIEKEIPFYSMCAHHFVPFYGHAHIAYIPESEVVGLSKLPRILEFYAKRPQLQERLTEQVAEFLWTRLEPQGVMVVIEARHLCVEMRGVKKAGALTTTSALRGCFADRLVREEFLALLRRQTAW